MSESPSATDLLTASREVLRRLADADHGQLVPADDQLAAENAVSLGVAELAGEPPPDLLTELPTRPILARDLLITVDLVLRALAAHETASQ